mgnify:CR=1 FL=1
MRSADKSIRDATAPISPAATVGIDATAGRPISVELRPIEEAHRAWFLGALARSRESVGRWLPLNRDGESDDAFFNRQLRLCAEGDTTQRSYRRLAVLDDGTPMGLFALNSISRGLSWEADAIWWVDAAHRGRGVATAGVRALLDHALGDMPQGLSLHGVHCGIEAGNDASVRVAEKCGFVHDPTKRSHLEVDGRWVMHEFYLATRKTVGATLRVSA